MDNAGEPLPVDMVRQLRSVPVGNDYLPEILVNPDPVSDPLVGTERRVGRMNYIFKAVVLKAQQIITAVKTPVPEATNSKQVAKEKRSKRVFDMPLDE